MTATENEAAVVERIPESPKSWLAALILSLVGGWLGLDQFYLGNVGLGVAKLVTLGAAGIWWFVDIVLITTGFARDGQGRRLLVGRKFEAPVPGRGGLTSGAALFAALGAAAGGLLSLLFFYWWFIFEYLTNGSFAAEAVIVKSIGLVLAGAIVILSLYTPRHPRLIGSTLVALGVLVAISGMLAFSWLCVAPVFPAQLTTSFFIYGWAPLLFLTLPLGMWPFVIAGVPVVSWGALLVLAAGLVALTTSHGDG